MLSAIREEGEVSKDAVLNELKEQTRSSLNYVSPAPASNIVDVFPVSFMRRVPGLDVAMGVTAYQLADMAKAITLAALYSGRTTVKVAKLLQSGLTSLWKDKNSLPQDDTETARQTVRGALHAINNTPEKIGQLAMPAVVGTVKAMNKVRVNPYDALHGAGYGVVEGSIEIGADLGHAVRGTIGGTQEIVKALHLDEKAAIERSVHGMLEAAQVLGNQAVERVKTALPDDLNAENPALSRKEDDDQNTAEKTA